MDTNTQDQSQVIDASAGIDITNEEQGSVQTGEETLAGSDGEQSKEHIEGAAGDAAHHHHASALSAASNIHSAVNHVLPHHRGIEL